MGARPAASGDQPLHIDVRHLEIFWAVMRSGSQRDAARLLGLSQPGVSKMLRYTEQRIGFPLFHRIRGRLHPTSEAQVFFNAVDGIFGRLDAAERLARDLRRRLTGRITITTSSAFNQALLPEAVAGFVATHALMQVGVKVLTPAAAVERVAHGEADLGLVFGPIEAAAVETHLLRSVPVICALPPGHRLACKAVLTAAELVAERLITATERPLWGKLLEQVLSASGGTPRVAVECTQPDIGFAMAAAGAGTAVMPAVPVRGAQAYGCDIRPLGSRIDIPLLAVTGRERPVPHAVSILIERLKEAALSVPWLGVGGP